jgi:AcrR family transcriptional regulator
MRHNARPTLQEAIPPAHLGAGARSIKLNMSKPAAARKTVEHLAPIRFSSYLEACALEVRKGQRSERSRLKLLAAGARLLDRSSFQDLKIEEVSVDAGLAKGTFYVHFPSKEDFLRQLADAYCGFELNTLPRRVRELSQFAAARLWISWYERTFAANAGILRCIVQMGVNDDGMRKLWLSRNASVVHAMIAETMSGVELAPEDMQSLLWTMRTVGGMLDQSLFDRYGLQTPSGLEDPSDIDALIEMHALLAYRALYGMEPQAEELEHGHALLHMSRQLKR